MLFNSYQYLLFFPIVAVLYFFSPAKKRYILLLAASYYFYLSWKPEYLILIIITTVVSFFTAKLIESDRIRKKRYLLLCLIVDFGILFVFKYFNFFNSIFHDLFRPGLEGNFFELKVLLPVGISFYTFQTVSYVIDVYRDKIKTEKNIAFFALYVSFFPQLVAGPIERAAHLLPQLKKAHDYDYKRIKSGIEMILFGFFKKIVIADRIAVVVDKAFGASDRLSSINLFIVILLFGIQIYCDFSGYSDIAIGSAKIMGIDLIQNFRRPYLSRSFKEFWSRWHISLSTWFKDYVYIPLGGSRKSGIRNILNILVTFVISGLWHGANYTFVLWGSIHGIFLVFERLFFNIRSRSILWILPTYLMTNLAWVLFRSSTIAQAISIYQKIFKIDLEFNIKAFGLSTYQLIVMVASILILMLHSFYKEKNYKIKILDKYGYALAMFAIIFFGYFSNQEFIYFRF